MKTLQLAGQSLCLIVALYHFLATGRVFEYLGFFVPVQSHTAISLAGALASMFLVPRGVDAAQRRWFHWAVDAVLTIGGVFALGIVVFNSEQVLLYSMLGELDYFGIVMSATLVVVLLEGVRRKTGWVLPLIILCLVGIVVFQQHMPGALYGQGFSIDRLLFASFVGNHGIFGLPLQVAVETIIVFVIFGAVVAASGAGAWFLEIALALTGRHRGGPAKAAVLASAMFGSVSGSPSANAASTGALTIPMMKRTGYTSHFAGAVEAVASAGGMILPPVMGAIAFVMAEWTGNSYGAIVKAAAVPAVLYLTIVFMSVHFQAGRDNIRALKSSDIPSLRATLRKGWFYVVPLFALCFFLFAADYPAGMAAAAAIPFAVAVSFLSPERDNWLSPRRLSRALIEAVHMWKGIAIITAAVGIMVGAMDLSGVGLNISVLLIDIAGGNLYIALLLVGVASLVLGMGLDATPAYITLATLLAPALVHLGVSEIGSHLFVIYWGLASFFTPPLCLAVFVTCSISGAGIWETGWDAVKLGAGVFLIPFAFAIEPALLLDGSFGDIAISAISALVGAVAIAASLRGYSIGHLTRWQRIAGGVGGVAMIYPMLLISVVGFLVAAFSLLIIWPNANRRANRRYPESGRVG